MAKIKRKPPTENDTKASNLSKSAPKKLVNLNLSATHEFRKDLKRYALEHDTSMIDIIVKAFNLYKEQNP